MIYDSAPVEESAILAVARQMCVAARTAPKTRGIDHLETRIVTDGDILSVAEEMDRLAPIFQMEFFSRDARNLRASQAVVFIGTSYAARELNEGCAYCNFENCAACKQGGGVCVYGPLDLGIAVGSAVSLAADMRVDNRVMFSAGRAALEMGLFPPHIRCVMAIPLSASGKSPNFDRK